MSRKCWENYVFLLHVVHDELVNLMGGEASELQFSKSGPSVILLAGLQGVERQQFANSLVTLKKVCSLCQI